MTDGELFLHVVTHLVKQKRPAQTGGGSCKYRLQCGEGPPLSCAVGCLIQDEYYHAALENKPAYTLEVRAALYKSGISRTQFKLVEALQLAHDDWDPGMAGANELKARLYGIRDTIDMDRIWAVAAEDLVWAV